MGPREDILTKTDLLESAKISVFGSFEEAKDSWLDFEQQSDHFAFQRFEWLSNWQRLVGIHSNLRIQIVAFECPRGQLVLLLPLCIRRRGTTSCLTWLGDVICDYHGPLVHRTFSDHFSPQAFRLIWQRILEALPSFDVIHFERQPEFINDQRDPFLTLPCVPSIESAHYFTMWGDWESFYESKKNSKIRASDRRLRRRLEDHGNLEYVLVQDPDSVAPVVDEMITQKSRRFDETGARNIFNEPGHAEFYHHMAKAHCADGLIHLSVLKLDGQILATHWGMIYDRRFYHLMPSYCAGPLNHYSPGRLLLRKNIAWSFENGIEITDFSTGDAPYKRYWCDRELKLFDYLASRTLSGALYVLQTRLIKTMKRSDSLIAAVRWGRRMARGSA